MIARHSVWSSVVVTVSLFALAALSSGQTMQSAQLASELRQALSAGRLTAAAAAVPDEPDRFVAASLVPGLGLLVLSARSTSPAYLADCVKRRAFQEAYSILHGTALAEGKFFVEDAGADGLQASRSGEAVTFDITWENGTRQVKFDGNAAGQQMTAAQYASAFDEQEARYAKLLSVLIEEVNKSAGIPEA